MFTHIKSLSLATFVLCVIVSAANRASSNNSSQAEHSGGDLISSTFQTEEGWTYEARIELPPIDRRRPWAVTLLGGGYGTDFDWTVPDQFTIDGHSTTNGATINRALLEAGYVVMRWNSIRADDPLNAKDPDLMQRPSYAQTISQAQAAFQHFRSHKVVPDDHIILLGHSNGARRLAFLLSESPVAGMILMSGGAFLPVKGEFVKATLENAKDCFKQSDRNGDGRLDAEELTGTDCIVAEKNLSTRLWKAIDFDSDQHMNQTEAIVFYLANRREVWLATEQSPSVDRMGQMWPADLFEKQAAPMLLLYGDKDPRVLSGYALAAHLYCTQYASFKFRVYEELGHELGIEQDNKIGPIDSNVVRDIVDWIDKLAAGEA